MLKGYQNTAKFENSKLYLLALRHEEITTLFLKRLALKRGIFNKLTSVFHASVLLLIMDFVITLSLVAVDPRGASRVEPQTTLTML